MRIWHRLGVLAIVGSLGLTVAASPAAAITDGRADGSNHPSVGIMYTDLPLMYGFCSGSLISPHEFLTAGHCTAGLDLLGVLAGLTPGQVHVSFDEKIAVDADTVISTAHPIAVSGWDTHPAWSMNGGIIRNDVGIIHLAQDVALPTVDLPPAGFLDAQAARNGLQGQDLVLVGYGFTGVDRAFNNKNAEITLSDGRRAGSATFLSLTADRLQMRDAACGGDSGGPTFFGGSYPNLAVATTSTGPASCSEGAGHSQRLDTPAVHDWLETFR